MAATTTLASTDAEKRLLHQHMTHSEKTSNRSYIRPDQAKVAAAGHAILKSNIGYRTSDDEGGDEVMDVDEGDEGCDIDEEEEEEEVVITAKEDLDEVEDTLLLDLFNNEISNVTLTQDLVTTKISKNIRLAQLNLTNKTLVKKIMNKLRYQRTIAARRRFERNTRDGAAARLIEYLDRGELFRGF